MICPSCKAAGAVVGGACLKCGAQVGELCQKCSGALAPGEKFCAGCGAEVKDSAERARERREKAEIDTHLNSARKWLLAVSVLTLLSGIAFYFIQSSQVEKEIEKAQRELAHLEPGERDALLKQNIGMTWDEAVAQDRGRVRLLLFVNIGLALIYGVLWVWARQKAFAASIIALSLFVTVIVVSAVLEPKSLAQGWLVKIFFTLALVKAISAAARGRRLYGRVA